MSIAYRTKQNKRPVGGELLIVAEQHTVGISGAFTSTPNRIRLVEVPLKEDPSTVAIPGYTEVDINGPAPTGNEFAVDYSLGHIYFDPAENGNTVFVTYKGRGSEVDSEDINELQIPVGTALNSNGSLVAGIVHPNNISTVLTDDFIFPRHVSVTSNSTVGGTISEGGSTLTINTSETGSPTLDAQLVVARGSSPSVSLRWNETLDAWEFLDETGSPIIQFFSTGEVDFSGPLLLDDGTVTNPSYSFTNEPGLGIYRSGAGTLDIVAGGTSLFTVNSIISSHVRHKFISGSAAAPSISFDTEDTGWYLAGASDPALSVAGVQVLDANASTGDLTSTLRVLLPSGTVATPSLSFSSDSSTGLYNPSASEINITLGGTDKVQFTATALNSLVKYQAPNGAVLTPAYTFASEPGTGISRQFANTMQFSIDGIGEVARFTPAGDFQLLEGEKLILDGVGNAFLRYTSATSMYGQTSNLGGFSFGSANELVLFANSVVGEPTLSMLTDGAVVVRNSSQGVAADRTLKLEISQQFTSGYHRTLQLFPSDAALGTAATGTATVVDYSMLSGATLTVDGVPLVEGSQWTASVDNNTTAASLATAIALSGVATGSALGNVVTITANTPGVEGNSIALTTTDPVNLTVSGATLSGGTDDFVLAFGYKADGTTVSAGTIDTHGFPLIVTVDDTEMMEVDSSTVDVKNHKITSVADPVADTDAANKRYVNNVAAGLDPKGSCLAGTTANLSVTASGSGVGKTLTATSNGILTLDGISTWVDMDNDGGVNDPFSTSTKASRVIVKNQSTASDNGIYAVKDKGSVSTPFILVRATDFDGSPSNEVSGGNFSFVEQGTDLGGTGWVVVASGTITVDTDAINWAQFSSGAIPVLAADPGTLTTGRVWFNTTDGQFKGYNGSSVVILG